MSDESISPNPYGSPTTSGAEPIGQHQGAVNWLIRILLHTPGISRVVGKRLLMLRVVGRKTGKVYNVPVAYTRHEGTLLIGTTLRPWVKNLQAGNTVEVLLGHAAQPFDPVVYTDEQDVMRLYEIIAADNHANAKFNGIGFAADGTPNKADMYQTWQQGGVVIALTPH
ncbi:nitroreductase/quinone reductase family protein [Nocardia australiensis]|uniref:nitroreductase/quinone reductase family protein n=1 Tax=Nocardia australiensis TaxID=2887191 RepID=UPI001D13A632|nr:nitroreductase/quinone reductase family protein [Nocardia australiensis]